MFLTADDLRDLTGKLRPTAQRAELEQMGIPYTVRRDGSVVVLRVAVEGVLGNATTTHQYQSPSLRLP